MSYRIIILIINVILLCQSSADHKTNESINDNKLIEVELININGGEYYIGTNKAINPYDGETPRRKIYIDDFYIDKYEISNYQFQKFINDTNYITEAEKFGWSFVFENLVSKEISDQITQAVAAAPWWIPVPNSSWLHPEGPNTNVFTSNKANHPVVHVSWNDAKKYCEWRNLRLPTEAEWEVAARGGKVDRLFTWGNILHPRGEHMANIWQGQFPKKNIMRDGYYDTAPINSFPPNGYGLHNMAGNVWEWVEDWWTTDHITEEILNKIPNNPMGPSNGHDKTKRGGSYMCHRRTCYRYHVAARSKNTPDSTAGNLGFRCAGSKTKTITRKQLKNEL